MKIRNIKSFTIACIFITSYSSCSKDNNPNVQESNSTAFITKVFEYCPAPGQFINQMPQYNEGDTQKDMINKVFEAIGNNRRGIISLGGYGGYVTVGFDHTIENKKGLCDFRVLGNTFSNTGNNVSGSSEPGIIMVSCDSNKNGIPDDKWFEIAGSAHNNYKEEWYDLFEQSNIDIKFYKNYEIKYKRLKKEYSDQEEYEEYIKWTDNKGNLGYISKNANNKQSYYPQWIDNDEITFKGSRLPNNGINKGSENMPFYVLYKFAYGYADNDMNTSKQAAIDIDWAIDTNGQLAALKGIDFIKIYTGINQINGWTGESSTEIMGIEDLHILNEFIKN